MSNSPSTIGGPVATKALWNWTAKVSGQQPIVSTYSSGAKTKSGVQPQDLKNYVVVPIQQYGNPPIPICDDTIYDWIRDAEDEIENDTNVLLCQTWVAAPPARSQQETQLLNLSTQYQLSATRRRLRFPGGSLRLLLRACTR